MAMVAMPLWANVEATANGLLFLLSPKPCPKIATGQPCVRRVPAGINKLKESSSVPCTEGTPVRVGTGGMNPPAVSQFFAVNLPKASVATDPGKTCNAGVGTGTVVSGPTV